jgi:hypothetical protein
LRMGFGRRRRGFLRLAKVGFFHVHGVSTAPAPGCSSNRGKPKQLIQNLFRRGFSMCFLSFSLIVFCFTLHPPRISVALSIRNQEGLIA